MNGKDERAKILERIKKLMALADDRGATEAEAMAAALAAQKLIAEYDVEEWELHSKDAEPIVKEKAEATPRKWRWKLAAVIGPAFRCRYYNSTVVNGYGKRRQHIVFVGYKTDARAAALTFNTLYRIGNRLANRYTQGCKYNTYNSYVLGFVNGIASELEKQTQALMIVVPPAVKDAYEEMRADFKTVNTSLTYNEQAGWAYQHGLQDGRDAVRSHRFDSAAEENEPVDEARLICA